MGIATVFEAQKNFSALLKRIHGEGEIIVTRHGNPVARLTTVEKRPME